MAKAKSKATSRKRTSATRTLRAPLKKRPEDLTSREKEILKLIWFGNSNKQAAYALHISVKTVEAHRANMMKKIRVSNTAGLLKAGLEQGVIAV